MEKSTVITLGAVAIGVGLAVYVGLNSNPTASPVSVQTPNTNAIDMANSQTQAVLTDLTTQQQIMNNLGLGTMQSTSVSSSTTSGG
jgi:negative regulator of sigma E activity